MAKEKKGASPNKGALAQLDDIVDKVLPHADWAVDLDAQSFRKSLPHYSTGSFVLDYQIGGQPNQYGVPPCPGIPKGRIIQVYGAESSGKTTFALTAAASVCRNGGTVLYIDWENEIVPAYAKALGVPIEDGTQFRLAQPRTLEEGLQIMWAAASRGVNLIVLDSVGAGVPKSIFEQKLEEQGDMGRVGLIAAKWSTFVPKLKHRINATGTSVIAIGQCRQKINTTGYGGGGKNVQGGDVWKYYSCLRMLLTRIKSENGKVRNRLTHKVEDRVIGGVIQSTLEKCKVSSSQGSKMEFYLKWGSGIDDVRSVMEIAIAYRIIRKDGSWYEWPIGTESLRAQGVENLKKIILEKDKYELLKGEAVKAIESAGGDAPDESPEDEEATDDITNFETT